MTDDEPRRGSFRHSSFVIRHSALISIGVPTRTFS
jgi:hypothetical protein